jgi:hypothetical protein
MSIDAGVVDPLYEKLLLITDAGGNPVPLLDDDGTPVLDGGNPVYRERRTTVNHAMKSCRRAWNVVSRIHGTAVPAKNPFARMGLKSATGVVTEATYAELLAAEAEADAMGMPSLAAAMRVTWEWLQREEHIFTEFRLDHYRPKGHPDEVLIVHPKSGDEVWIPLFDDRGVPTFPELMARMDALKLNRIGGLFFVRDWVDRRSEAPVPWVTRSGDLTYVRKTNKKTILDAGLRPELSFTSFRHGGFTELGDAELTDTEIRALSRQKSSNVVRGYVKRTQRQIIEGTRKRRALRPAAPAQDDGEQLTFDQLLRGAVR